MIMHVAEAGEQRGRVVLHLTSGQPSPIALEAAIRIARAFNSEIESLFVEDSQLFEMANYPFAREVPRFGGRARTLSREDLERQFRLTAQSIARRIEALARAAEVTAHARVMRGIPLSVLAQACAECGPWNVVALGDPLTGTAAEQLRLLFEHVADITGLVLVGPRAQRTSGPIVAALEDIDHLPHLLRVSERLAGALGGEIAVLLLSETQEMVHLMEDQVRLALGSPPGLRMMAIAGHHSAPAALAETLRRLRAGFVLGQYGGILVPREGDLRPLVAALECPLFVMR